MNVSKPQYTTYLSHSWLPDHVGLNRRVWDLIWADVKTVVDVTDDDTRPYYINRIESALRRADLFLAILAAPADAPPGYAGSPYQQFEMALATRSDLPRLAVHDERLALPTDVLRSCGFEIAEFNSHDWAGLDAIRSWLERVAAEQRPQSSPLHRTIGVLLNDDVRDNDRREAGQIVATRLGLKLTVITADLTDAEVIARMRGLDVLVADLGGRSSWATYGIAHGLMVPSIRLVHGAGPASVADLPPVLRGHEAGYQLDLVAWSNSSDLVGKLEPRVACLYTPVEVLDDRASGHAYFARHH